MELGFWVDALLDDDSSLTDVELASLYGASYFS